MTQYDNTNRGALFANKDRDNDNQPNATGSLNVDGKEYLLAAWTKTSKKGEKYQSLSVKPKPGRQPVDDGPPDDVFGDSTIPF
jgi:uncharacterized protein (DUF736 family)